MVPSSDITNVTIPLGDLYVAYDILKCEHRRNRDRHNRCLLLGLICFAVVSGNLKTKVSNIVINKEIGLLSVAVTRRESGCFKTSVTDEKKPVTQ